MEAERRLEQISEMAGSGLPAGVWWAIIFLVGFPASLIFIPDIGARVLGASLKYNMANKSELAFQGSCTITLTSDPGGNAINSSNRETMAQVLSFMKTRIQLTQKDTGGNAVYKISYPQYVIDGLPGHQGPVEAPAELLAAWGQTRSINAHGDRITSGVDFDSINQLARTARHHANLYQQGAMDREREYNQETSIDQSNDWAYDDRNKSFSSMSADDAAFYQMNLLFSYPKDRIRSGATWKQKLHILMNAGLFRAIGTLDNADVRLVGYSRSLNGFNAILEWWGNFTPKIMSQESDVQSILGRLMISGDYHGKTWVRYADGMINKVEGTVNLTMNGDPGDVDFLIKRFNPNASSGSGAIAFHCEQRVLRE